MKSVVVFVDVVFVFGLFGLTLLLIWRKRGLSFAVFAVAALLHLTVTHFLHRMLLLPLPFN